MLLRQQIINEINKIPDDKLMDLHQAIKKISRTTKHKKKVGLIAKLKAIKIKGPDNFAENIDDYLREESGGQ